MEGVFNWEEEWKRMIGSGNISDSSYWNKRAEDYNDYIETSNFEHGMKIRENLEAAGILKEDIEVLDIAAGPGSVSIPIAQSVGKVTVIEPAEEMLKYLTKNAEKKDVTNIEMVKSTWQEVNENEWQKSFDLVICVHALWHFPDIGDQVMRMNQVSRGYCCLVDGVNNDDLTEMYHKLGIKEERFNRFIYLFNILFHRGILSNVRMFDVLMKRSRRSAETMWELVLSKYREPDDRDRKLIKDYLDENCRNGLYQKKSKMALIWWKVKS